MDAITHKNGDSKTQSNDNNASGLSTQKGSTTTAASTTEFVQMNTETQSIPRVMPSYQSTILKNASTGFHQDIKEFLAKPIITATATYSTAAVNTNLITLFPSSLLSSVPMWADKIRGFRAFRGTCVMRIVMNLYQFQAGSLLAYYTPNGSLVDTLYETRVSLKAKSQLPSVVVEACNSEVIIKIPFVSQTAYYDRADASANTGNWGSFYVDTYTVLRTGTGGLNNAKVTVYTSWEDVDLQTPVWNVQSGEFEGILQMGVQEKEVKTVDGPLTKIFSTGQQVAKAIGGIPVLSSISTPAWWLMGLGKSVASMYGWSKPMVNTEINRMVRSSFFGTFNADGKDTGQPLSLMASNMVETISGIPGHDLDEMSIDFIKRQWAYLETFTLTTSQTSGTVYYRRLSPKLTQDVVNFTNNGANIRGIQHTSISWLQSMFRSYRGSMKFRFRFIKTAFHTGTVAFAYVPYDDTTTTITEAKLAYLHAEHVDLKEVDSYEIVLPYADVNLYLNKTKPYGSLYVYLVNPLRAPETAASTIDVVVEVCGADDLEFAIPYNRFSAAFTVQSGLFEKLSGDCQSGVKMTEKNETCQNLESDLGFSELTIDNRNASYAVGEKIMSVLQILKAYTKVFMTGITPEVELGGDGFAFNPHLIGSVAINPIVSANSGTYMAGPVGDALSYIAPCYAFRRGGVRIQITTLGSASTVVRAALRIDDKNPGDTPSPGAAWWSTVSANQFNNSFVGGSTVIFPIGEKIVYSPPGDIAQYQIPFYSKNLLAPNHPVLYRGPTEPSFYPYDLPNTSFAFQTPNTVSTDTVIQRAVADDFQLAYWIGPPVYQEHGDIA